MIMKIYNMDSNEKNILLSNLIARCDASLTNDKEFSKKLKNEIEYIIKRMEDF